MQKFSFLGKKYEYFVSPYNDTRHNERAVEVPIIMGYVSCCQRSGGSILELGNVISNYYLFTHTIVDKYEPANNVINEDIITYEPSQKFDLIFSISTLEHVGWDEEGIDKSSSKALQAIERLKSMLNANGVLIVTIPLGHNTLLDEEIKKGINSFSGLYCLKRGSYNEWEERSLKEVFEGEYGGDITWGTGTRCIHCNKPFPVFFTPATSLVIGIYINEISN